MNSMNTADPAECHQGTPCEGSAATQKPMQDRCFYGEQTVCGFFRHATSDDEYAQARCVSSAMTDSVQW
jgi:hypothetical protein